MTKIGVKMAYFGHIWGACWTGKCKKCVFYTKMGKGIEKKVCFRFWSKKSTTKCSSFLHPFSKKSALTGRYTLENIF